MICEVFSQNKTEISGPTCEGHENLEVAVCKDSRFSLQEVPNVQIEKSSCILLTKAEVNQSINEQTPKKKFNLIPPNLLKC